MSPWFAPPPDSHFSLHNLPYGVFRPSAEAAPRIGVRLGDAVIDLAALVEAGLPADLPPSAAAALRQPMLNPFMALGRAAWRAARTGLQALLRDPASPLRCDPALQQRVLHDAAAVTMELPAQIGDFTDFYSSLHHAFNVGALWRGPQQALLPNWRHLPVAYHGRAGTIVVGDAPIRRPWGQILPDDAPSDAPQPVYAPTRQLDFELEVGLLIGPGSAPGQPVPVGRAWEHIFGLVLVNDWSARDIQSWEYRPLGPFNGKNFATSISPWVVTLEALEPFLVDGPPQEPPPLPYLRGKSHRTYDLHLEVALQTGPAAAPAVICRTNFRTLYWSMCQQIAHHTSGGCRLRTGDLLASGTISGPTPDSLGCLLELTEGGRRPLTLPGGATRTFLEDGDSVAFTGYAQGDGYRVGFGVLRGEIEIEIPC